MKFELRQLQAYGVSHALIQKVVAAIAYVLPRYSRYEISVAIVDNETIKRLNTSYRHRRSITDVLSFAEMDSKQKFVGSQGYLGEIVIAYPRTARQAKENNHSVQEELVILLVHGFLHLAGYDHSVLRDARLMQRYERRIRGVLEKINN
jgi:probable rRNA maturation factor